jgi:hypothetical protein
MNALHVSTAETISTKTCPSTNAGVKKHTRLYGKGGEVFPSAATLVFSSFLPWGRKLKYIVTAEYQDVIPCVVILLKVLCLCGVRFCICLETVV